MGYWMNSFDTSQQANRILKSVLESMHLAGDKKQIEIPQVFGTVPRFINDRNLDEGGRRHQT